MKTIRFLIAIAVVFAIIVPPSSVFADDSNLITITVSTPQQVIYGRHPLTVSVKLANTSEGPQDFDASIWVGGKAWYGSDQANATAGTEIYWVSCNLDGCTFSWRGTIPPHTEVEFTDTGFSGVYTGTYELVEVNLSQPEAQSVTQSITLVPAEGQLRGTLTGYMVNPQVYQLRLVAEAGSLVQFKSAGIQSDCGITLGGFMSSYLRTYEMYTWDIFMPDTVNVCRFSITIEALQTGEEITLTNTFGPHISLSKHDLIAHFNLMEPNWQNLGFEMTSDGDRPAIWEGQVIQSDLPACAASSFPAWSVLGPGQTTRLTIGISSYCLRPGTYHLTYQLIVGSEEMGVLQTEEVGVTIDVEGSIAFLPLVNR